MAVPKKKVSKSRRNKRRSHISVDNLNIVFNKQTGEPQLQHHVSVDGYYNGKKVIADKVKKDSAQDDAAKQEQEVEQVVSVEEEVSTEKEEAKSPAKEEVSKKEKAEENK